MSMDYEQEVFAFFTKEDNFSQMCKIAEYLPAIKSQLLQHFWTNVEQELKGLYYRDGDVWKVKRIEPLYSGISKLMAYKPEWGVIENACPQIAVGFESLTHKPFYGPFIHNREQSLQVETSVGYLRQLPMATQYQADDTTWYPFWEFLAFTFEDMESFRLILPGNITETAGNTARLLYEMSRVLEKDLDYIHKEFRGAK